MGWEAVQPDNSGILSLDVVGVTLVHKCTMQSDLVGTREVKATTKRTIVNVTHLQIEIGVRISGKER